MSDGRKYFCFCADNCKFETMTKEQILAAIAQAAAGGLVFDADAAFVTKVKESNAGGYVTFWVGTQAQYNAIEEKDPACMYIITDSTEKQDMLNAIEEAKKAAEEAATSAAQAGVQIVKLWTNNDPQATFAAQTIQIDGLSEYTHIGVVTDWNCRAGALQLSGMQIFELSAMTGENLAALSMVLIGTEIEAGSRKMGYDGTNGITFQAGKLIEKENNTAIVPHAIYGIKGVM